MRLPCVFVVLSLFSFFRFGYTYSETSTNHIWEVDVDTNESTRKKYLYSEEKKDGSGGKMEIFNYLSEANELVYTYEWAFDNEGNLTITEVDGAETFEYEIKSNVNLSGSAKISSNGVVVYNFQWNSDGSGSVTYYDENGIQTYSDAWTTADLN